MGKEAITGNQLRVAMWHQATWESETAGTAYELPVAMQGAKFGETQELIDSLVARGGRKEQVPYDGKITADDMTLSVVAHYTTIVHILKHGLGDTVTTTVGTPNVHELEVDDLPPAFGLEIALVDATPASSTLWKCYGCRLKSLSLPFAGPAGEIQVQMTFSARKVEKSTAAPMTATTYTEDPIMLNDMDTFTVNGAGVLDVTEATLKLDFEYEGHHTANNGGRLGMFSSGRAKVRGNLKGLLHVDETYTGLAEAGTLFEIIANFSSGTDGFNLDMGHCRFKKPPVSVGGPQGIPLDCEFGAYENTADADTPIKVTVDNDHDGTDY